MTSHRIASARGPATAAAPARTTPGDRFLQGRDLDGNSAATPSERREMRGCGFASVDAAEKDLPGTDESVYPVKARANDGATCETGQREQLQSVADGLGLTASDADGAVGREDFLACTDDRFARLDRNGDDAITIADFPM